MTAICVSKGMTMWIITSVNLRSIILLFICENLHVYSIILLFMIKNLSSYSIILFVRENHYVHSIILLFIWGHFYVYSIILLFMNMKKKIIFNNLVTYMRKSWFIFKKSWFICDKSCNWICIKIYQYEYTSRFININIHQNLLSIEHPSDSLNINKLKFIEHKSRVSNINRDWSNIHQDFDIWITRLSIITQDFCIHV